MTSIWTPYTDPLYAAPQKIADLMDRPIDEVMCIFCIVLNFFVSLLMSLVRHVKLRIWLNTILGFLMTFYAFGCTAGVYVVFNMISFMVIRTSTDEKCSLGNQRSKVLPRVLWLTGLCLLAINFVRQFLLHITGFNIGTLMMITFVKQMQFSFNYHDGGRLSLPDHGMTKREIQLAIRDEISLESYLSYMFNLQSSVIGPSFEFKYWDEFIKLEGNHAKMRLTSNWIPALFRFLTGLLIMAVGLVLSGPFDLWVVISSEFATFSFPYQVFFAVMVAV